MVEKWSKSVNFDSFARVMRARKALLPVLTEMSEMSKFNDILRVLARSLGAGQIDLRNGLKWHKVPFSVNFCHFWPKEASQAQIKGWKPPI